MTTYYSQAGEDRFLWENLFKERQGAKTYLEVGALDGELYSNTKFFEDEHGWTGVLIEPHPVLFDTLCSNRPGNHLYNSLVSSAQEAIEYSYFIQPNLAAVSGASSTLTPKNRERFFESDEEWLKQARTNGLRHQMMEPVTLDSIIEDSGIESFTLMSIDVEGHELSLLQSFSFRQSVDAMLVESGPDSPEIKKLLATKGLHFWGEVAHNKLYTTTELLPS